jgi:starch phosphorylase
MRPLRPLVGTNHGYLYETATPERRPLSDYTPRIVPASSRIATPAESTLILWHH